MHRDEPAFHFDPAHLPEPGHRRVSLNLSTYTVREARPHTRQDGAASAVISWRTVCKDCLTPFDFTTGPATAHRAMRQRCDACKGAMSFGERQKVSYENARRVKAGHLDLKPKYLVSIAYDPDRHALQCVFGFNDRKKRHATYRLGEVRCGAARDADFSRFTQGLEALLDQEMRESLF